ncbi:outer membrane beta-barrel protein [Vibrio methylphosphonaticus]|uniref:outer membrane beta-barrel protein n=1 Tax=Vibrio methylphosphonaticus TaxID=2946866 RepID=UPI00202A2B3D|nr:outer membrane beta-barrel protein [Vibrio methylphosphonaticus]MCL9776122.1 porin family protein [Vibrio methylphosphonaticus]
MIKATVAFISLSVVSTLSQAGTIQDFFSGVTVGAGYATDSSDGNTLQGYSVYSQGYLVPSLKESLFTDFRVTTTSGNLGSTSDDEKKYGHSVDVDRYQAAIGYGVPYHVSSSVVVKPYVTAGWSWDKVKGSRQNGSNNSFVASVGVKGEFNDHIMTGVGYSKETSGFKSGQWLVDVGYQF